MRVEVLYFASLRDAAGCARESVDTDAASARALLRELHARHGFALGPERMRVALDGEFADWDAALAEGMEVALIPPVSGG